jgi:hypothetical protein
MGWVGLARIDVEKSAYHQQSGKPSLAEIDQDFVMFLEATFEICLTVRFMRSILGDNF